MPQVHRLVPSIDAPAIATLNAAGGAVQRATSVVRGACPHDCPDTCALVVTVEDGKVSKVAGDPSHPTTHGALCTKVARYAERTYHRDRLRQPMRRIGPKGSGRFEPVSSDEALAAIATRLKCIAARDPQRILPYSYAGTMGFVQGEGMAMRFFHRLGASLLDRTICSRAGAVALQYTLGAPVGMDIERFADAKLILIWGSNPITSNLHFWTLAQQAKRRGARLVAIDPYRSDTAMKCHEHIALLPGTDAALALGMMHVLIEESLIDSDYIEAHTLGFDALAARARQYSPQRVAAICGIEPATVIELARQYGRARPAAIRLNYGMQRTRGGGNAVRAIACLPAMVGAWRDPAGGLLLSASGHHPLTPEAHMRPDLLAQYGHRPRTINMSTIGQDLCRADPPIEALIVYNANPVAVAPQSEQVIAGFQREDLFTVVLEHFMTDTADYADYVLPATTQLEHFDLHKTYGHRYLVVNEPAIAPIGEARPNSEIFRQLAAHMGFDDPCLYEDDLAVAASALDWGDPRLAGWSLERLRREGWAKLQLPDAPFASGGFPTPSGRCEFHSPRLLAQGLDPLPAHLPPRESVEASPTLAARFPLAMISPPSRHYMNSTFVNVDSLRAADPEPACELHPEEARIRGLIDGQWVSMFNDRGRCELRLRVSDRVRPGVVVAWGIWWQKMSRGGRNINVLTSQALTDMGKAPTFYDCLVEVGALAELGDTD